MGGRCCRGLVGRTEPVYVVRRIKSRSSNYKHCDGGDWSARVVIGMVTHAGGHCHEH